MGREGIGAPKAVENLRAFTDHLINTRFTGTLVVSFAKGTPFRVSRKESFDAPALEGFLRRPIIVRAKATAPIVSDEKGEPLPTAKPDILGPTEKPEPQV
jgi:hypothetical protein